MTPSTNSARGFSLIEVLVTLILISIGVLGMVALQGRAIQYTQDSVQRNTAAMLANDLVEMIRAKANVRVLDDVSNRRDEDRSDENGKTFSDGRFAKLVDTGFFKAADEDFPDEPGACVPMPDDAADQLSCWANQSVVSALPGASDLLAGDFYVCRTNVPGECNGEGDTIEIQLAWSVKSGECLDGDADGTTCRYRLLTRVF